MTACDCHSVGANDNAGRNRPKRWAVCDGETLTTLSADFADLFYGWNVNVSYSDYIKLTASQQKELEDLSNVTIVGIPETCEHGEHKYDYCADGSRVDTDVCIPPDWYDTQSDCEKCTVSAGRTKICSEATGDLPAGSEIVTHRCVGGRWIEVARCHEDAECYGEGDEKKVTCDDGTEIVTHRCVNYEWVPTGNHCPGSGGGGACVTGDVHTVVCDDGSEIVTERCIGGEWVGTGNTCPDAGGCTSDVTEICPDGSSITTKRCDEGTLVDTGATCPEKKDKGILKIAATLIGLYLYLRG